VKHWRTTRRIATEENRNIGAIAQRLDTLPIANRAQIDRTSMKRITLALGVYILGLVVLAGVVPQYAPQPDSSIPIFIPWVVIAAFVFETLDSASGMGFGATLGALLLAFGYPPLAVVPVLLISETATGLVGGLFHTEFENVRFGFGDESATEATKILALVVGVGTVAIVISVVLAYLAISVQGSVVQAYVGAVILLCALTTLLQNYAQPTSEYQPRRMAAFAALAGLNKGITGSGFGPVVTLGEILSGIYEKSATAIASMSEGLVSLAGIVSFFGITAIGVSVNLMLLPSVFAGGFLAAILAPYTVRVMPNDALKYVVPGYAVVLAIVLFVQLV
jgi:uncharacterized membrane protein YfcA